jgi:hypothetical protein
LRVQPIFISIRSHQFPALTSFPPLLMTAMSALTAMTAFPMSAMQRLRLRYLDVTI